MKKSKIINAPNGLTGAELSAWKAAGCPPKWPPPEFPELPSKDKMLAKIAEPKRRGPVPGGVNYLKRRLKRQNEVSAQFKINPEYSRYFKVFVETGGVVHCLNGEMDQITKQCNFEKISVPRSILPQTLLAIYGKRLKNIIYEASF